MILKEMIEAGKLKPLVDKSYPLTQVSQAYHYLQSKRARGKIVVAFPG
jgi:alcohol dehydrogenase